MAALIAGVFSTRFFSRCLNALAERPFILGVSPLLLFDRRLSVDDVGSCIAWSAALCRRAGLPDWARPPWLTPCIRGA
jgi:hypothetical protein